MLQQSSACYIPSLPSTLLFVVQQCPGWMHCCCHFFHRCFAADDSLRTAHTSFIPPAIASQAHLQSGRTPHCQPHGDPPGYQHDSCLLSSTYRRPHHNHATQARMLLLHLQATAGKYIQVLLSKAGLLAPCAYVPCCKCPVQARNASHAIPSSGP